MRKLFNKIASWLVGFGIEPYLHILITAFIAMVIARVCLLTGADRFLAGFLAAFGAFVVGLVKESWDNKVEKLYEGKDVLCNLIGAVFFFLCWI